MDFAALPEMNIYERGLLEQLNSADFFILAMDEEIRRDGLAGSYGCWGLELSAPPDTVALQQRIGEFRERFPHSTASLHQIGRRFYWCKREEPPDPLIIHHCPADQNETEFREDTIRQIMNHKQSREEVTPVEFHLFSGRTSASFLIKWFHPFCDARGADLILKYLCSPDEAKRKQFGIPEKRSPEATHLGKYRWWQQVGLLWKAKRYIEQLDRLESIQPSHSAALPERLNYAIHRLSPAQTERVVQLARQNVGLTGMSLYYIGCLMRALETLNPVAAGAAYCVPYVFNLRRQRALTPVTGNHVCPLFAQAAREVVRNRRELFAYLKRHNEEAIRRELDYAFLPLMRLGSELSLDRYGKTLRLSYGSKKERSSFWFSDIGRLDIPADGFPGAEIVDIFHVCQVTSPPALALLSCIFRDRLILSYNFIEPVICPKIIARLHSLMLAELLGEVD